MYNAKAELQVSLQEAGPIKGAIIVCKGIEIVLELDHSPSDLDEFWRKLDFEYDDGYGSQELFGVVWLSDGTWLDRDEYDGSERWKHQKLPDFEEVRKELNF